LSRRDEDFQRLSWSQVQDVVKTKCIDRFERTSSQLRAYLEYIYHLKKKHGSVLSYIQHERLGWENVTPSGGRPFTNPKDVRVLYNDWPYFIDEDIKHLVVWTKFLIDQDETTGEVREEARALIEDFINRMFCSRMDRDRIIWFRNWGGLKSVHALEHFHVMVYRAPADLLDTVTGGDRPRSESWSDAADSLSDYQDLTPR